MISRAVSVVVRCPCRAVLLGAAGAVLSGCYVLAPGDGGGQTIASSVRPVGAGNVALPEGYAIETVASGLDFPCAALFDDQGALYVVEAGYCYGEVWATPRLLRIEPDGSRREIARGDNPPWTGAAFHEGRFYIAEGGQRYGGRILSIAPDGQTRVLIENLPSVGDHHTNGPVIGPDRRIYFGQGTATNSGVVGEDNAEFGWLERYPDFCDIPAFDVRLTGENFSGKELTGRGSVTGAFRPYGTPTRAGEVIRGRVPCTGAIMSIGLDGGEPDVVAWGLRNPFGLCFGADGRLYVTDNSYDSRGSRPVWGSGDLMWAIDVGAPPVWYGWPDFHGPWPLTKSDQYGPPGLKPNPEFVMAEHPNTPPRPAAVLDVHAAASGLDFSRSDAFGHVGEAFVALFGDMAPGVGKVMAPVGFKVVRVDPRTGVIEEFATNRAGRGPASKLGVSGLERPVACRFSPDGAALYVVDFGVLTSDEEGHRPRLGTGVLWRITRERGLTLGGSDVARR